MIELVTNLEMQVDSKKLQFYFKQRFVDYISWFVSEALEKLEKETNYRKLNKIYIT